MNAAPGKGLEGVFLPAGGAGAVADVMFQAVCLYEDTAKARNVV